VVARIKRYQGGGAADLDAESRLDTVYNAAREAALQTTPPPSDAGESRLDTVYNAARDAALQTTPPPTAEAAPSSGLPVSGRTAAQVAAAPFTGGASLLAGPVIDAAGRVVDVIRGRDQPTEPPTQPGVQTGPPPVPGQPPDIVDDESELKQQREEDRNKQTRIVQHDSNDPLPQARQAKDHPYYDSFTQASNVINQKDAERSWPNSKVRDKYVAELNKLRSRIDSETKAANKEVEDKRKEELKAMNAPFQTPEQRDKTATVMTTPINRLADAKQVEADAGGDKGLQASYNIRTSPLTTMSRKTKDKDGNETVDYTPFRDAVTSIAMLNGHTNLSNDQVVNYGMQIGMPGGGIDPATGKQIVGMNGRKGAGATNYEVLGRDASGIVRIRMRDGRELRVDRDTLSTFEQARERAYKEGKAWEEEQKKANAPTFGGRILRAIIPRKGF
jgi:hypothetical protein